MATLEIHCISRRTHLSPEFSVEFATSIDKKLPGHRQTLQNIVFQQHGLPDRSNCIVRFCIFVSRESLLLEATYEIEFHTEQPVTRCIKIEQWAIEIMIRCFIVSTSEPLQQRSLNNLKHDLELINSLQYIEAEREKMELILQNKAQTTGKNKIQLTSQHLLHQKISKNNEKLKKMTKTAMNFDEFWNVCPQGNIELKEHPEYDYIQVEKSTVKNMNPSKWKTKSAEPYHLIVMVHGMNGSSHDFRHFRKLFQQLVHCQKHRYIFLVSRKNQVQHHISLEEQGQQLAKQVLEFVQPYKNELALVSFVGHSLGGVVVRVALPKLFTISHQLHCYVSLSAPHIGFLESGKLFGLGVRFLLQSRHEPFVKQLLFQDEKQLQDCYLYRLGETDGLNWFNRIILMGSEQDRYVGRESALLSANSGQALKLAEKCLQGLTASQMVRYDIKFRISQRNFDSLTGRTAHLRFLQQKQVVELVVSEILKEL